MKLHTETIGDGDKHAALVHGISGNGETWFELAPWIAEHGYTVTMVDQRGHGKSGRADTYTADDLADDLVETLPQGLDLIIGHSLGGRTLALAVDRLRPQRAIYLDPGWDIPADLVLEVPRNDDGSIIDADRFLELFPGRSRAQAEQAVRSWADFDVSMISPPHFPIPSMAPAEHPVVPSLVVVPDSTTVVLPPLQERLQAGGYTLRVIPNAQHDLHVDNLPETKQAVEDWL